MLCQFGADIVEYIPQFTQIMPPSEVRFIKGPEGLYEVYEQKRGDIPPLDGYESKNPDNRDVATVLKEILDGEPKPDDIRVVRMNIRPGHLWYDVLVK